MLAALEPAAPQITLASRPHPTFDGEPDDPPPEPALPDGPLDLAGLYGRPAPVGPPDPTLRLDPDAAAAARARLNGDPPGDPPEPPPGKGSAWLRGENGKVQSYFIDLPEAWAGQADALRAAGFLAKDGDGEDAVERLDIAKALAAHADAQSHIGSLRRGRGPEAAAPDDPAGYLAAAPPELIAELAERGDAALEELAPVLQQMHRAGVSAEAGAAMLEAARLEAAKQNTPAAKAAREARAEEARAAEIDRVQREQESEFRQHLGARHAEEMTAIENRLMGLAARGDMARGTAEALATQARMDPAFAKTMREFVGLRAGVPPPDDRMDGAARDNDLSGSLMQDMQNPKYATDPTFRNAAREREARRQAATGELETHAAIGGRLVTFKD